METITSSRIKKILKVGVMQSVFNAEERGDIPKAQRISRGKTSVRHWTMEQLPQIGRKFGFLKPPENQRVICVYTQKGGVLKSTLSYSLARMLALNGIRVIIVGVDTQGSITKTALAIRQPESLDELKQIRKQWGGLYNLFNDDADIKDIVRSTDITTLDIIPENPTLRPLERWLSGETNRERVFKTKLLPLLKDYEVVIFDNPPNWSHLVENCLVASNYIVSPIGCDVGTFDVLETNLEQVWGFKSQMKEEADWKDFIMVPTLLEKTKLSSQIYGTYANTYGDYITPTPIRRAVAGQESSFTRKTVIEHDPSSALAQDYFDVLSAVWGRIVK